MTHLRFLLASSILCFYNGWAQFSGQGSGIADDPYQITTVDELFDVRNDLTAHYKLMCDLDLTEWIQEDNPSTGWEPIGSSTPFSGVFDGNNKNISGLYINKPNVNYVGLFSTLKNATIKNLKITNANITGGGYSGILSGSCMYSSFNNITMIHPILNSSGDYTGCISGLCTNSMTDKARMSNIQIYEAILNGKLYCGTCVGKSLYLDYSDIKIINTTIVGKRELGGIAGRIVSGSTNNCYIIKPVITGEMYDIGGIVGYFTDERKSGPSCEISNCIVINGLLTGSNESTNGSCGGIAGISYGFGASTTYTIQNCYFSGEIIGSKIAGIVGRPYAYTYLYKNRVDANLTASGLYEIGGIWGNDVLNPELNVHGGNQNIFIGNIYNSRNYTYGIGSLDNFYDNVCIADTLSGSNCYRIGNTLNNYAYANTKLLCDGIISNFEDGGLNGSQSYGLRTLKRKNSYLGFGFDFDNDWSIVDGKTFPYNINQSTPPSVSNLVLGNNGKISGSASGDGDIYIFAGDETIKGEIVNGEWEVNLGNIAENTKIKLSAVTDDRLPSILITADNVDSGNDEPAVTSIDVTLNQEYGTFCAKYTLDFTSVNDIKAYTVAGYHEGSVMLMRAKIVPAGEGVLLRGIPGKYTIPTTDTQYIYSNLLIGTTNDITIEPTCGDKTNFILTSGNNGIGFYPIGNTGTLAGGKAYLQLPTSVIPQNTRSYSLIFDDLTTNLNDISKKNADKYYYTIEGIRIKEKPQTKGIYIRNGKKIIIK